MRERPFTERETIKNGDIICLEFNVDGDNSYIKFSRTGTNEACIITADEINMSVKYRLAASICDQHKSFSIVDFTDT